MRGPYFAATFALLCAAPSSFAQPQYRLVDLGSLGGDGSVAYGINALGDVFGVSTTTVVGPQHAFLYREGRMIDVHPAGVESTAFAINNSGQIVGRYSDSDTHGFTYRDGQVTGMPGSVKC
jgi:probable HAF family extracellular repeat protein